MTGFPNRQTVERLREQFKSGITVELTAAMEDPYHPLPAGLRGECCGVDDAGQIMMIWNESLFTYIVIYYCSNCQVINVMF